jgi:hypothetical protein
MVEGKAPLAVLFLLARTRRRRPCRVAAGANRLDGFALVCGCFARVRNVGAAMHQSPEKTMIALRKLNFAVVVWALASGVAFADTVALKADLEPSSEVPPRVSHGHGMLNATFDTSTKSLQWTITYEGLSGPATAAHFHGPAPVGQNAKIQVPIGKDVLASPIKGSAALTEQQVTDLMAGQWYFNVHTAQNPMGEIRGQVLPAN